MSVTTYRYQPTVRNIQVIWSYVRRHKGRCCALSCHSCNNILITLWSERENQQDATVRCLLSTLSQHYSHSVVQILISLQLRMCLCGTRYLVIRTKCRQCKLSADVTPVPVFRTNNQKKQNPSSAVQQQMVLQLVHRRPSLETLKQGWTNFQKINI